MRRSEYDLVVLQERAELWRAEAAAATLELMRIFCLTEAVQCERRVEMSRSTPVIREIANRQGFSPRLSGKRAPQAIPIGVKTLSSAK
jgi:hypothetical protein